MEWLLSVCLGLGLAAACGFRIFVPMLGMSIAAQAGHLDLSPGFEWIDSPAAIVCFSVATAIEIFAYYIPWVDNALDSVATPAAVVAGTILTASVMTEMSPLMQWSVALIAGGGAAGIVQSGTVLLRGTSSVTTGGSANFMVSTVEWVSAAGTTLLAILLPVLAALGVIALVSLILIWLMVRRTPAKCVADSIVEKPAPKQMLL
jgi:hypothetical protein